MKTYGVTLLSGGLDSTTVSTYAKGAADQLTALTFHYGQTHSKEVGHARRVAWRLGLAHELLDISFLGKVAWYSALTNPERFPLPTERRDDEIGYSVPITYVPLRNTIFISLGAAFLESQVLYAIEVEGAAPNDVAARLYLAPNAIDYSGYPDCRPEYYARIQEAVGYGSKLWTQYQVPIQIETPIIHMSKAEIVRWAVELQAPLELTWSCYQGGARPCGACDSCLLRARGFAEAGLPDPALA